MMTMMAIMLALASSVLWAALNSPREAIYRSLTVAVSSVGAGAVPYVPMLLLSLLLFLLLSFHDRCHLVVFASCRYH